MTFSRLRAGFSLVEVNLALLIAAGGLLSIFGVFPGALRQSVMASSDLVQATFAASVLDSFYANTQCIDDIAVWNDPEKWWDVATQNTGLEDLKLLSAKQFEGSSAFAGPTRSLVQEALDSKALIFYAGDEDVKVKNQPNNKILKPAQFLIRLSVCERNALRCTGKDADGHFTADTLTTKDGNEIFLPNRYLVSVISTDQSFPNTYHNSEQVFCQEYSFLHRP